MATNGKAKPTETGFALLRTSLASAYLERGEVIDACLTALVAGEHVLLLGPPGTAKSALVRAYAKSLGEVYFETLFHRFMTPEELYGPIMVSALRDRDAYVRQTGQYLPCAGVAFLDEVFKGNLGIVNSMLGVLNERTFCNDGAPVRVPLKHAVGASNELPEGGVTGELGALWDRFMVRQWIAPLADRGNFLAMVRAPEPSIPSVGLDVGAEQAKACAVTLGDDVYEALADIRAAVAAEGAYVSDRRWRKSAALVRASAHLDGRTVGTPDDLSILDSVLWNEPGERSSVARLVQATINPNAARAVEALDAAREAVSKLPNERDVQRKEYLAALADTNQTLREIATRLGTLGTGRKIDTAKAEVGRLQVQVSTAASKAMGMAFGAT